MQQELGHDGCAVRERFLAIGLTVGFAALYLWASPSLAHQHWDSLEYGYATDSRGPSAIWGNHPLGHAMHRVLYASARRLGYDGHALPLLKGLSAAAGGAAVGAFFVLLTRLRQWARSRPVDRRDSVAADLGWTLVLGGAYGFWRFAGTADIYTIGALALILASIVLLSAVRHGSIFAAAGAGALTGIATLSHQFTGVLLAAMAIGLLPLWRRHGWPRAGLAMGAMAAAAALIVAAGYAGFGWIALGSGDPSRILAWAKGYSGDPTYGRYMTLLGLSHAIFASTETLARHTEGTLEIIRRVLLGGGLLWLLVASWRLGRLSSPEREASRAAVFQCAVGWLLVIWWEPGLVGKFWILLLPGFLIWCRYALLATAGHRLRLLPVVAGLLVIGGNWTNAMAFERQPNVVFERSLALWIEHSHPDDVIVETGRFTGHLLFWGRRPRTANVYRLLQEGHRSGDPYAPMRELFSRTQGEGRDVLFAPGLSSYFTDDRLSVVGTNAKDLVAFFDGYRWDGPLFEYQEDSGHPVKQAYRLAR
jgi:hypothetical protein